MQFQGYSFKIRDKTRSRGTYCPTCVDGSSRRLLLSRGGRAASYLATAARAHGRATVRIRGTVVTRLPLRCIFNFNMRLHTPFLILENLSGNCNSDMPTWALSML